MIRRYRWQWLIGSAAVAIAGYILSNRIELFLLPLFITMIGFTQKKG